MAWWPLSPCTGNAVPDVLNTAHGTAADLAWTVDAEFGTVPQFDSEQEVGFCDAHLPAGAAPRIRGPGGTIYAVTGYRKADAIDALLEIDAVRSTESQR